jgi:hypothetical protein
VNDINFILIVYRSYVKITLPVAAGVVISAVVAAGVVAAGVVSAGVVGTAGVKKEHRLLGDILFDILFTIPMLLNIAENSLIITPPQLFMYFFTMFLELALHYRNNILYFPLLFPPAKASLLALKLLCFNHSIQG